MNQPNSTPEPKVTAGLIAEAAAWVAVLHGPNRTSAAEHGFSQWMKKSASHARAFEEATEIWEESRNLPRRRALSTRSPSFSLQKFSAAAAILALSAIGIALYLKNSAIETNIGEQRVLALDDGSRVILNTGTRVVVSYSREVRRVELKGGEALFEVARKPGRPFVVTAGDRRIEALGTSFVVRRDARQLAVTLVEGKVAVSSLSSTAVTLAPGERIVFAETQPMRKDHPQLEKLLAWQRREVALDNTTLPDAVAEMNRYNRIPLVVETPEPADIRVTGLFRAGDSLSFARAVAEAYKLQVVEEPDRIVLSGAGGLH